MLINISKQLYEFSKTCKQGHQAKTLKKWPFPKNSLCIWSNYYQYGFDFGMNYTIIRMIYILLNTIYKECYNKRVINCIIWHKYALSDVKRAKFKIRKFLPLKLIKTFLSTNYIAEKYVRPEGWLWFWRDEYDIWRDDMIIGGMIMVFGGTIMTKRRDDYDFRRDELIPISESGTPVRKQLRHIRRPWLSWTFISDI